MLPGIELDRSWFTNPLNTPGGQIIPYPGSGTFAEIVHFNMSCCSSSTTTKDSGGGGGGGSGGSGGSSNNPISGTISISTVSGPDFTIPHYLGFVPEDPNDKSSWTFKHKALTNITAGCNPLLTAEKGVHPGEGPPCNVGYRGVIRTRFTFGGTATEDVTLYVLA